MLENRLCAKTCVHGEVGKGLFTGGLFDPAVEGAGEALALKIGVEIEHVDVTLGDEVGEAGDLAVGFRNESLVRGAAGEEAGFVEIVGRPGGDLGGGVVAQAEHANAGPEEREQGGAVSGSIKADGHAGEFARGGEGMEAGIARRRVLP